jgi:hypothetical protein
VSVEDVKQPSLMDRMLEARRARAAANRADRVRATAAPRARALPALRPAAAGVEAKIDGLLVAWHVWRSGYTLSSGYRGSDATCQDYRAPTHWDWKNGASQERVEDQIMRGVDRAIARIPNTPHRWRTAIEFEARDLSCGAKVWSTEVLPKDPAELAVLRIEARNRLVLELRREGVLT